MRVLVTGDREWDDPVAISMALNGLLKAALNDWDVLIVISGNARGADRMAEAWYGGNEDGEHAIHEAVFHEIYPADWKKNGRAAGPIRNQQMLDTGVDICIAFHNTLSMSKGTQDMVKRCVKADVPVYNVRKIERDFFE